MSNNRRSFIKKATTGFIGSAVLPGIVFANNDKIDWGFLQSPDASEEFWETVREQFSFAPGLRYFNNGSLGPSPLTVQRQTNQFRETLDAFPSKYMWGGWNDEKEATREKIAKLHSVSAEEIAIIHNTTEGMNMIARSFELEPGDEIIVADHEHSSGTVCWQVWQETKGVKLIRPTLPMLPNSVDEVVEVYRKAITPRTKIISMCHIVNTTGMILPVKEVSAMAHQKGIMVAVDGAQAAGMLKVDLNDLGCDFYAASSHKWLFSPKGVGVFYARKESQHHLKPLVVARGHKDKSIRRLENYNTRNLPEVLGLGSSIDFINSIGAQKIEDRTYHLKAYFRAKLEGNAKFKLKSPLLDSQSAAIQVVEVVGKDVRDIKNSLFEEYGIDSRPMTTFELNALRLSFAVYITKAEIDYLVDALETLAG